MNAAAPLEHPREHRHFEVGVIVDAHLTLAFAQTVQPARVLRDSAAPRHGKRQEQRVQARIVEALADVPTSGKDDARLIARNGSELLGNGPLPLLARPRAQDDKMTHIGGQQLCKALKMICSFREHERRAAALHGLGHVVADAAVAQLVIDQFPNQRLELDPRVRFGAAARLEGRRPHENPVLERPGHCLRLRVHAVAHRPALHENNGMVAVLAFHGRRQPDDEPRFGPTRHLLEALGRQMMALVDDELAIVGDLVGNHALVDQALNEGDVDPPVRPSSSAADAADRAGRQTEESRQPFDPLVEQLLPVHQHQRAYAAMCDEPGRDHGLAEGSRGGEHPRLMRQQRLCSYHLLGPQFTVKAQLQGLTAAALVAQRCAHTQVFQSTAHIVEAATRQCEVQRMVLGAGDDARLAVGGKPHRLRPVELRVLKRRQSHQAVHQTGWQSLLGNVDLVREHQLQRQRQLARDGRLLAPARGGQGPRLVFSFFLHGQAHTQDAPALLSFTDDAFDLCPT